LTPFVSAAFGLDMDHLRSLGITDPGSSQVVEAIRSGALTSDERLFLSLMSSSLLMEISFDARKRILEAGGPVDEAYVIQLGSLLGVDGETIYRLGPGSVVGLAEGVVNKPARMTVITTTTVQARVIPLHKIDATIATLPTEAKAMLQTIIKRTLAM